MLRKSFLISYFTWLALVSSGAQSSITPVHTDTIYHPDIATVLIQNGSTLAAFPVLNLQGTATFTLTFDDLRGAGRRLRYEIIHLDHHWNKDDLNETEYINGFNRSEIRTFEFSTNRNIDYTQYYLTLPNRDVQFTKSGNYIIHIYEEPKKGQRDYLFSRRFLVVDPKVTVTARLNRSLDQDKYDSYQEVYVAINHKGFPIYQPRNELFLSIIQNGRWKTRISDITYNKEKTDLYIYDYINKLSFKAGKEFRNVDLRIIRSRNRYIKKVEESNEDIILSLRPDKNRRFVNFVDEQDLNGAYFIDDLETIRSAGLNIGLVSPRSLNILNPKASTSGEYVWADFSLEMDELFDQKVYIIGAFNDWQCKEPYLMTYDKVNNKYIGSAFLKQGFYNYAYAVLEKDGEINSSEIEGDWTETENDYQIMVYYKPFGSRYDQLIAFSTFNASDYTRRN